MRICGRALPISHFSGPVGWYPEGGWKLGRALYGLRAQVKNRPTKGVALSLRPHLKCPSLLQCAPVPAWCQGLPTGQSSEMRQQNLEIKNMAFEVRPPGLDSMDVNCLYLSFPIIKWV